MGLQISALDKKIEEVDTKVEALKAEITSAAEIAVLEARVRELQEKLAEKT